MRQSINFVQKSIDPKPSIMDMIKAYTVLKLIRDIQGPAPIF